MTYAFLLVAGGVFLGFGWMVVVAAWVIAGVCTSFFVISWVYGVLTSRLLLPSCVPIVLAWIPGVVVGSWFAWRALGSANRIPYSYARELLLLSIGFGVHGSALLFCTRNRRQRTRRRRLGLCVDCGYDVAGQSGTRCPECGASVGDDQSHAARIGAS